MTKRRTIEAAGMDTLLELGDTVRDVVTGFEGVIEAVTHWRFGCRRICVQSQKLKDGVPTNRQTFDEPALEVLKRANVPAKEQKRRAATGGPRPTPYKQRAPSR